MKRQVVGFISAAVIAFASGCSKTDKGQEASGEVLARVNKSVITMNDFDREKENLPPYIKGSLDTFEGKKQFLDNLVTKELLLQKARQIKMDQEPAVASRLEELKETLMVEALLKREIEGKAAVTEKEAEEYYNSHTDEFSSGEKAKIGHIMVKTEKEAGEILKRLQKKENFEKLAKKHSIGPTASTGGELGYLEKGTVLPEFEEAAFKLENAGDISPVVKAGNGYHIIKLIEKTEAKLPPFEEIKDKIIAAQIKKKQRELFENFVAALKKDARLEVNDSLLKEGEKEETADIPAGEKIDEGSKD